MKKIRQKCITDFNLEEDEVLRDIPGFPRYKVSNYGKVISYVNPKKPKLLRAAKTLAGYFQVSLQKEGKEYKIQAHRLVAMAFIPNPDNKPFVDHIDTDTTNSHESNLRWVTSKENSSNPLTVQHMKEVRQKITEKNSHEVYVYDENLTELSSFTSTAEAARSLNYNQGNISSCCMGSLPRYKGLIWSYTRLQSMEERKAHEEAARDKFNKNRASTNIAMRQWQKRNRERYIQRIIDYYWQHRDEILEKRRKKKWEGDERKKDR